MCNALIVSDKFKAELVQEGAEGAHPANQRLIRGIHGHQDVSVVSGPYKEPARLSVVVSGAVEACEVATFVAAMTGCRCR